jgi:acyl transferase domain-containing protein/acyl carrier protein
MLQPELIAVVGMGCRFPGGVNTPAEFWKLLRDGVDAITEVPAGRWNAARFYHPNASAPGRMVTRWGGFVDNVDSFDAPFFGIAPREASRIDPQQRWLLETAWEAMEDAGLPPEQLAGTRTGVFIGISHSDYPAMHRRDALSVDGYVNSGSALSIAANRVSFHFDLHGPSMAVDTACSSSLVALHLAVRSLQTGESDYALIGGANALLAPQTSIGFSQARMLSPRGRCRTFDIGADGYVRAEGAAAVLLVPWKTAKSLGLKARALVVTTGANQDGRSSSLAVPSQQAQEAMIRDAFQRAAIDPQDLAYIEAHGTGTTVGDRIEVRALASVLPEGRGSNELLLLGSVKTNLGHMEAASGIAGLIKAVLVLEQRAVPPNLHFETPNPRLPLAKFHIPTRLTPLPAREGRMPLVAVNSFGFGGTNAHALLSPPPAEERAVEASSPVDTPDIFPLSARCPTALADYADAYERILNPPHDVSLRELCSAVALGKSHHPVRHAVVAASLDDLKQQLTSFRASIGDRQFSSAPPKIAFVFSGQGSQWWAMGRQLYERDKVVRDVWHRCDTVCRKLGGPPLLDALLACEAESPLAWTEVAQPALFALQAGLTELWRSWGILPDAVLGHSVGEAAAAWAAGFFTYESIFRVILGRSRCQGTKRGQGRMLAASISRREAEEWTRRFKGRVDIAAFNAPQQITLSGETSALAAIAKALSEASTFHRLLPMEYAFHSAQMEPLEEQFRSEMRDVCGMDASVPMISTVTGERVLGSELNADYWWRNVRQPVQFAAGIERLIQDGCNTFVEIGPHSAMAASLVEIAAKEKVALTSVASLRRGEDERGTMLHGLATLYRLGSSVRWAGLYERPRRSISLPPYPWQRRRLWHESPAIARELRSAPSHPLLGDRQPLPQPTWLNHLDSRKISWLVDHRLSGSVVLPAAAYLEMAAAAVREHLGEETIFLEELRFHRALFVPEEQSIPTCVRLDPAASSVAVYAASPDAPDNWLLHAEGIYRPGKLHPPPPIELAAWREDHTSGRDPKEIYRQLSDMGQMYGPTFQGLNSLHLSGTDSALAKISPSAERDSPDYLLFPPLLDCCIHPSAALKRRRDTRAVMVVEIRQLRMFQTLPAEVWSRVRMVERSAQVNVGEITIHGVDGSVLVELNGIKLRTMEARTAEQVLPFYAMAWEPAPLGPLSGTRRIENEDTVIIADQVKLGIGLTEAMRAKGGQVTFVLARDGAASPANAEVLQVDLRSTTWAIDMWRSLAARGSFPACIITLWADPLERSAALLALSQAADCDRRLRWLIVTNRGQQVLDGESNQPIAATIWGFSRVLQSEQSKWQISLVDSAESVSPGALLREWQATDYEPEIALRSDQRWVRRLRILKPRRSESTSGPPAFKLQLGQLSGLDSVQFRGTPRRPPLLGEVEVEVAAAALNFRDLMKVLGIYPSDGDQSLTLGDEFSGRVLRVGRGVRSVRPGDRVMGFAPKGGAFGSNVTVEAQALCPIPADLSFTEAATIPVAFGTAFHALHTLARLQRGERILIHAAAGGVGLAAVQLAQRIGAVVLATAGSDAKRDFLRSIGVDHVMDSRTLDFADEVLRITDGTGVNVVLNSLSGAFQQKSLEVCAPHGRFVEIGKRDLYANSAMPLQAFKRSLAFFAFDLTSVLASRGPSERALRRFLAKVAHQKQFTSLAHTCFPAHDALTAFRAMQSTRLIGKIVLKFESDKPPEVPVEFWPDDNATYLITGGCSGFGLATACWLADRGARHLALVSRSGKPSESDTPIVTALRNRGVTIHLASVDVAQPKALAACLRRLKRSAPPLRGVFHAAMVLRDRPLAEMTAEDITAVLAPKVDGALNLHRQTSALPLDCFVLFSSMSALVGPPGQANYAAANAFLDALADHRRHLGLPALCIHWGQIADVGVAANNPDISLYLQSLGVRAISSGDALAALSRLIPSGETHVGVMDLDWQRLSRVSAKFKYSPVFRDLVAISNDAGTCTANRSNWRDSILLLPEDEQVTALTDLIIAQIATTLGRRAADISPAESLSGMDSLMAVELKVRIDTHAGCEFPIDALGAHSTVTQLAERLLQQMRQMPVTLDSGNVSIEQSEDPVRISAPLLRLESLPLLDLMRGGKLAPLTAAAVMPWPITLFQQTGVPPAVFMERMHRGRVSLDLILETTLGSVGIFMLPLTTEQVRPGEPLLIPHVIESMRHAAACGAHCTALTGLIPSATNYGVDVQSACSGDGDIALPTTGHATTIAAVIFNLGAILLASDRSIDDEIVMFNGIGSIGLGALRLMLSVLPHPAELRLCDPFRSDSFFGDLVASLRAKYGFRGRISIVKHGRDGAANSYDATVIVGATNVGDVLELTRLAPGTLVVDDSSPHCLNGPAALSRLAQDEDILFTEGGFIRGPSAMPRIAYVPPRVANHLPAELPQLFFSMLRAEDITACILSALLTARRADLPPTIGLVSPEAARQHYTAITELGFSAAELNYEGTYLPPDSVARFRERFRRRR